MSQLTTRLSSALGVLLIAGTVWIVSQSTTSSSVLSGVWREIAGIFGLAAPLLEAPATPAVAPPQLAAAEPAEPQVPGALSAAAPAAATPRPAGGRVARAVRPRPADRATWLATARTLLQNGQPAAAAEKLLGLLQAEPENAEARELLVRAQIESKQPEPARQNLAVWQTAVGESPAYFGYLGQIEILADNLPAAFTALEKSGDTAPVPRAMLDAFYDKQTEVQDLLANSTDYAAKTLLAAYTEYARFPESPKTHLDTLLARAFNATGYFTLAAAKLQPVIAANPDYRDAWLLLGYSYYARAKYPAARQAYQTAYDLDPTRAEAQYFLGLTAVQLHDLPAAEEYFMLALKNKYAHPAEVTRQLAEVTYAAGKFDAAAGYYAALLRLGEVDVTAFTRPIYLYLEKLHDGNTAWRLAQQAVAAYPQSAEAQNLAGWVSIKNGFLDEGYDYLVRATELNPALPAPYYNFGLYYEAKNSLENAQKMYRKAYELDPAGGIGRLSAEAYNRLLPAAQPAN